MVNRTRKESRDRSAAAHFWNLATQIEAMDKLTASERREAVSMLYSTLTPGARRLVDAARKEHGGSPFRNPKLTSAEMSEFWERAAEERLAEAMGFADVYEWQEWKVEQGAERGSGRRKRGKKKTKRSRDHILHRAVRGT